MHSAVNLDKKLEESSTGLPETNHSKSMAGNKTTSSSHYNNNNIIICVAFLVQTLHSPSIILYWDNLVKFQVVHSVSCKVVCCFFLQISDLNGGTV